MIPRTACEELYLSLLRPQGELQNCKHPVTSCYFFSQWKLLNSFAMRVKLRLLFEGSLEGPDRLVVKRREMWRFEIWNGEGLWQRWGSLGFLKRERDSSCHSPCTIPFLWYVFIPFLLCLVFCQHVGSLTDLSPDVQGWMWFAQESTSLDMVAHSVANCTVFWVTTYDIYMVRVFLVSHIYMYIYMHMYVYVM